MKAVLQRVTAASVTVEGETVGSIGKGLAILLGVTETDSGQDARILAKKTAELRIFSDEDDKMNLSLLDIGGGALVVSQFTLCADCRKGRRPSFVTAMRPPRAEELYHYYCRLLKEAGAADVQTGSFGADMKFYIENDGPVTIVLDTDELQPKG